MRRAEDLLEDSDDFLGAARDLLATGRWAKVCFMAQQAAELAVKAALNALGRERRMHSVHKLLEELAGLLSGGGDIAALIDDAKILDQYYIPTRYMNAFSEGSAKSHFTEKQAREAVKIAEKIFSRMERIVRERGRRG